MMHWIGQAVRQVFAERKYILIAAAVAFTAFVIATWLPNLALVWQIVRSPSIPSLDKIRILATLIGSIGTNFTIFSAFAVTMIAMLFGMNIAMIVYVIGQRRQFSQHISGVAATSFSGLATGLLGIGCVACGALVLSPALFLAGGGALVGLFPFGGEEFSVIGIVILLLSLTLVARQISQQASCRILSVKNWENRSPSAE